MPKQRPERPAPADATWRLFLAVPLPQPVVELVGRTVEDLAALDWPVRWVAASTAHVTLHFLGETPIERVEILRLALPEVVARHEAFRLRTADLGVFPNQKRPRVIWLGLYGPAHRLVTLQEDLGRTLRTLEFPVDDAPFHPHVTLGRLRDVRNQPVRDLPAKIVSRLTAEAECGRVSAKNALPVPVDEVVLYRSHLSHEGARYEAIARCPLAPKPPRPPRSPDTPEEA